ncbi:MAG: hypothetical protein R3F28_01675 [Candidatus Kapaibacterium sp.]|nr:hypothetical protein [Ignavibacteria bacterium]
MTSQQAFSFTVQNDWLLDAILAGDKAAKEIAKSDYSNSAKTFIKREEIYLEIKSYIADEGLAGVDIVHSNNQVILLFREPQLAIILKKMRDNKITLTSSPRSKLMSHQDLPLLYQGQWIRPTYAFLAYQEHREHKNIQMGNLICITHGDEVAWNVEKDFRTGTIRLVDTQLKFGFRDDNVVYDKTTSDFLALINKKQEEGKEQKKRKNRVTPIVRKPEQELNFRRE